MIKTVIHKIIEFLLACLLFSLQVTLFKNLEIATVSPNLMIIFLASFAFMRGQKEGIVLGFISGLFVDIYFSSFIGFYALLYMIVGFFIGIFKKGFFQDDIKLPVCLIGLADLVLNLMVFFFKFLFRGDFKLLFYLKSIIIPEMLYTVLVSFLLYPLLFWINKKLEESEKRSARKFD